MQWNVSGALWRVVPLYLCFALLPAHADSDDSAHFLADAHGCKVHNRRPVPGETVTWSGSCQQGFADGPGVVQWLAPDGTPGSRLEANFVHGIAQGRGKLAAASGTVYQGEFLDGVPHGQGEMQWPNGDRYVGDWSHGLRTGSGVLTRVGGDRYEGHFDDGRWTGVGTFRTGSGERYEGEWRNNLRDGHGVFVSDKGERWEGEWKEGRAQSPAAPAAASAPAQDDAGGKSYALRDDVTGSHILTAWVKLALPPDKAYAELTDAQKALVRSRYEAMAESDVPPYPAHGEGAILRVVRRVLQAIESRGPRTKGLADFVVTIDPAGKPVQVAVIKSPDPELTHAIAMVLAKSEFTPALCKGAPCRMDYPFRINFE